MKILYFLIISLLFTACTSSMGSNNTNKNIYAHEENGFVAKKFQTNDFILYGLLRPATENNNKLHVYIEGDGLAWINRNTISNNPTPTLNTGKDLALNDFSKGAVLYLARPCQYYSKEELENCNYKYWTNHRLAPEVINSINAAINEAKQSTGASEISLVGYSGGAGVAVLVAAMRDDVYFLGSVAGLLDHNTWTNYHKVSPLNGSLNPIDVVENIKDLNQKHLTGSSDKTIPPVVNAKFCARLINPKSCIQLKKIKHSGDWYKAWDYSAY